ncbi:MAG: hypothetical protein D6828_03660 [Nitrospirae bacterium]|nr:MAG: hypothetical protein D6828_03660 [Nitrospirota bacterium]
MKKLNCWEVNKCGLEPGGVNAKKYGVCIAATMKELDGVNSGKNGGRACWAILGTLCLQEGKPKSQSTFSSKLARCSACRFFELVAIEEDDEFKNTKEILEILKKNKKSA